MFGCLISQMIRLLIQLKSETIFGGGLIDKGIYKTFNEAVDAALLLLDDSTIETILVADGSQFVRIK